MIFLKNYFVATTEAVDYIPILHDVRFAIRDSKFPEGLVTISLPAPEAALCIHPEIPAAALQEKFAAAPPRELPALSFPFDKQELLLAPKQMIYLIDYGTTGKRREFFVQVLGKETPPPRQPAGRGRR